VPSIFIFTVFLCAVFKDLGDMYWIHLAQDREEYQALSNTIMDLQIPQIQENSCAAERLFILKNNSAPWSCFLFIYSVLSALKGSSSLYMIGT
jgi:hypothetical protein